MELVAAGYEKQLLMGLDTTAARLQSYSGEPGLVYIKEKFIQKLREIGILDSLIRLFFEENPARTFSKSR
jgi:phosphotriesterase-related protein